MERDKAAAPDDLTGWETQVRTLGARHARYGAEP